MPSIQIANAVAPLILVILMIFGGLYTNLGACDRPAAPFREKRALAGGAVHLMVAAAAPPTARLPGVQTRSRSS